MKKMILGFVCGVTMLLLAGMLFNEAVENYEYAKYVDEYSLKVEEFNNKYDRVQVKMIFDSNDEMQIETYLDGELFVTQHPESFDYLIEIMAE